MRRRATLWILVAALASAVPALAGDLEARLDRSRVGPGETVQLLLRARGDASEAPDLTPLSQDFDILGVQQSLRTSIVNGRRDASTDWWVELAPRHGGRIEIPALRAGAAASLPLLLEVASARSPDSGGARTSAPAGPVAVEAQVDVRDPYVQGKVLLTLRVEAAPEVMSGTLAEPEVGDALVERVGEDRQYTRDAGGVPIRVIERQYAVFPQRSGELRIPPVAFQGRARDPRARPTRDPFADFFGGSPFDAVFGPPSGGLGSFFANGSGPGSLLDRFFGSPGRPVVARSEPLVLDVKPRPEQAAGEWFVPARKVELIDRWESDPPHFRVGEPVTRVVTIRATGLSGAQLPELEYPEVDGLKQYREPSIDETFAVGDDVVAVKGQKTALIPTRPGKLTLPALELAWWDTEAEQARVARIPARTIQVLPASGRTQAAAPPPSPAGPDHEAGPAAPAAVAPASAPAWGGLPGTAAGALLVLIAAIWVMRRGRRETPPAPATAGRAAAPDLRAAERDLQRACRAGDAGAALRSLRDLAAARWPDGPPSASAWAERLSAPDLERAVAELQRVQYSPGAGGWDGSALWQAYRAARADVAPRGGAAGALPSLYPAP